MRRTTGGVLFPKGYSCAVAYSGKAEKPYPDFAILQSETPASCATLYFKKSANLTSLVAKENLSDGIAENLLFIGKGVNVYDNSGKYKAEYYCEWAERIGNVISENTLPVTFGENLTCAEPEELKDEFESLFKKEDTSEESFNRLFNSDFDDKERVAVEFELGGKDCRLGALAGTYHLPHNPMSVVITTDACIAPDTLDRILRESYDRTLSKIVRQKTFCDSIIIMANGMAENAEINSDGIDYTLFSMVLGYVLNTLKKPLAMADGEKYIEVKVSGTEDNANAEKIARAVMTDCVVKKLLATSKNPLQGVLPVLSAYGIDIASVSVALRSKGGFIEVFKRGIETDFNIELLRLVTTYEDIELFVSVGDGEGVGEACGNEKN